MHSLQDVIPSGAAALSLHLDRSQAAPEGSKPADTTWPAVSVSEVLDPSVAGMLPHDEALAGGSLGMTSVGIAHLILQIGISRGCCAVAPGSAWFESLAPVDRRIIIDKKLHTQVPDKVPQ